MKSSLLNALCIDADDLSYSLVENGFKLPNAKFEADEEMRMLLDMLQGMAIHATFFIPGIFMTRAPELVKRIANEGHQVASHGWTHCFVWQLTPQKYTEELKRSRTTLEDLVGQKVDTYKAPFWSISPRCRWALDCLIEAGYSVDHTLMPGMKALLGEKPESLIPFVYKNALRIIPPTVVNVLGVSVRFCGGFYNAYVPKWVQTKVYGSMNDRGLPFNFYFHPYECTPHGGNRRWIKYGAVLPSLYGMHTGVYQRTLPALGKHFNFTTLKEAYKLPELSRV